MAQIKKTLSYPEKNFTWHKDKISFRNENHIQFMVAGKSTIKPPLNTKLKIYIENAGIYQQNCPDSYGFIGYIPRKLIPFIKWNFGIIKDITIVNYLEFRGKLSKPVVNLTLVDETELSYISKLIEIFDE